MVSPVIKWVEEKTGLRNNLNPVTLKAWQQEKLREVVEYCRANTRFYADKRGLTNELTDMPFTSPADLAAEPLAFIAIPQSEVARITTLAHSGTTHLRKRIFFSKDDLERTREFFAVGMSTMVEKGDSARILISNRTENSLGILLKDSLSRIGVAAEIIPSIRSAGEAIEASRDIGCLIGMPGEILYMCKTEPGLRPGSVLLAADIAVPQVIDSIREVWKCDVFTHYGHSEFGYGCAVDCKHHDGLHTRDADFIFEIIDVNTGKPATPGESGEIVITTLSHAAMPLIRYRTGNISRLINTRCGCGGLLNRIGNIEKRLSSVITISDSKDLDIAYLDEIIFSDPAIRGFDATLINENGSFTLLLVIDSIGSVDAKSLKEKLQIDINIKIRFGGADPFEHRGKRMICLL